MSEQSNKPPMKAAVIGRPITHSKSPLIHRHWLERYDLRGSYDAVDIRPENLSYQLKQMVEEEGYTGLNVTVPHKEAVLPLCDELDEAAQAIGAVNTIVIEEGKIKGRNTDAFGFTENIKTALPDFKFSDGPAYVLGAGGAAKAVLYALLKEGASEIYLSNRTRERAEDLAAVSPDRIKVADWDDFTNLQHCHFLVNTTSLGMQYKPPLEIDLSSLNTQTIVNDIVYAPLMTSFLQQSKMRGNKIVTGIGMLLHQARPAFEAWTGIMPEIDEELEEKVLA